MKDSIDLKKYYGFYRGEVVQLLNNGFCRIRIPDILESIDGNINTLPPAEPAQTIGGGANTVNGTFTYPALGSIVWCFFEGGNLERPVYFATSNAKAEKWDSISVATPGNGNEGNDGVTVYSTGHITAFDKTAIRLHTAVDSGGVVKGNEIDLVVNTTAEQEKMYNNANASMPDSEAIPAPFASAIHMDNIKNILSLTAKDSIIIRAPKILIDTTGFGQPGSIVFISDAIENVLKNNGPYRVIGAKVNIDGGTNDVITQTLGEIFHLKGTGGGAS
jgi:hypothetical protein